MKLKYLLFICLLIVTVHSSCKKDSGISFEEQLASDEIRIKEFIAKNNIPAIRHESGVYYQIIEKGAGELISANTLITVNYTLRFLNGQVVQKSEQPYTERLGNLIPAWIKVIPLIQKSGKIRIISPSAYAYGPAGLGSIPPNAVLDFEIELLDARN